MRSVKPIEERFWQKIDLDGECARPELGRCWRWLGAKNSLGYGLLGKGRREELLVKAHRASWEIHKGPIPNGMWVLHACDNPECCRIEHLFLGNAQDNVSDMYRKGRAPVGQQVSKLLADHDVIDIRTLASFGARNKDLALAFGISRPLSTMIVKRQRWKHLP